MFTRQYRRAFTLIELLVVIAVVALLISIILPALGKARKSARTLICQSNLKQYGTANASYAATFQNRLPAYSWGPGKTESAWPDLQNPTDPGMATMFQATDIVRRRAGRDVDLPRLDGRYPQRHYTHLILLDFMGEKLPFAVFACPEDRVLLGWQRNPVSPDDPPQGWDNFGTVPGKYWPYASTYQVIPASWSPDQTGGGLNNTVAPYKPNHNLFFAAGPRVLLGRRRASEVVFPSSKVLYFELFSRHRGRLNYFYAYPEAIVNTLFFDGSVSLRQTQNANRGFNPNAPTGNAPFVTYKSQVTNWEPPAVSGKTNGDDLYVWYRFTRAGLKGVDFGGSEVKTK